MIQIRNVRDGLHRQLKARAALVGVSLSDYLLNEIRQAADRPTPDEMRARLQLRPSTELSVLPAQAIHAERNRH
jgi:plasmid stability protein